MVSPDSDAGDEDEASRWVQDAVDGIECDFRVADPFAFTADSLDDAGGRFRWHRCRGRGARGSAVQARRSSRWRWRRVVSDRRGSGERWWQQMRRPASDRPWNRRLVPADVPAEVPDRVPADVPERVPETEPS